MRAAQLRSALPDSSHRSPPCGPCVAGPLGVVRCRYAHSVRVFASARAPPMSRARASRVRATPGPTATIRSADARARSSLPPAVTRRAASTIHRYQQKDGCEAADRIGRSLAENPPYIPRRRKSCDASHRAGDSAICGEARWIAHEKAIVMGSATRPSSGAVTTGTSSSSSEHCRQVRRNGPPRDCRASCATIPAPSHRVGFGPAGGRGRGPGAPRRLRPSGRPRRALEDPDVARGRPGPEPRRPGRSGRRRCSYSSLECVVECVDE